MLYLKRCVFVVLSACASQPPPPAGLTELEAAAQRHACGYASGALPAETIGAELKQGAEIPIDHVVLIMQENRPFDHYYSKLDIPGLNVAPADATNVGADGGVVQRYHETRYCVRDPNHSWNGAHDQFDDGHNDGFVLTNGDDGERAMGYYDESDLPFYYALARTFALSDAHFASVMGPTMPNRLTYFAGTSFGQIQNSIPPLEDSSGRSYPNVFSRLDEVNVGWRVYTTNTGTPAVFLSLLQKHLDRFVALDQFFTDLGQGNLAPVSVVEAGYGEGIANNEDDEHAESNIQLGQQFVARVVNAVMASGSWPHAVVFLSYDEHGGFYDHVPPPPACKPDDLEPIADTQGRHFDRYGFRVPLMVISPYARRGYLSHTVTDHTSILRFLAARFGFKALTARDANADPLLEMFDFDHPDVSVPMLPEAVVDDTRVRLCKADFPQSGM